VPLVVESCIRFINLNGKHSPAPAALAPGTRHLVQVASPGREGTLPASSLSSAGLQHEGIFRISGAQPRISEIRDAFERGGDRQVGVAVGALQTQLASSPRHVAHLTARRGGPSGGGLHRPRPRLSGWRAEALLPEPGTPTLPPRPV
jgi:hypothetical protein